MTVELIVAVGILAGTMFSVAFSFALEWKLARAYYVRSVAMMLVDGEMEVLAAGEWRAFPIGSSEYAVTSRAAENLPPGRFLLTRSAEKVRLEWVPERKRSGGVLWREAALLRAPGEREE